MECEVELTKDNVEDEAEDVAWSDTEMGVARAMWSRIPRRNGLGRGSCGHDCDCRERDTSLQRPSIYAKLTVLGLLA